MVSERKCQHVLPPVSPLYGLGWSVVTFLFGCYCYFLPSLFVAGLSLNFSSSSDFHTSLFKQLSYISRGLPRFLQPSSLSSSQLFSVISRPSFFL